MEGVATVAPHCGQVIAFPTSAPQNGQIMTFHPQSNFFPQPYCFKFGRIVSIIRERMNLHDV